MVMDYKSIPGRSDYPDWHKPKTKCPYDKCNGSGLLPFRKDGKVIPNVLVQCDCYADQTQGIYQDLTPDCFDYPMSATFRAASFEYCGIPDPGQVELSSKIGQLPEQVIVHRHSNMSKLEADLLQQTAGKLEHVSKTLNEHLNYRKRQPNKGLYDSV